MRLAIARVLRALVPPAIRRRLREWVPDDRPPAERFGTIYGERNWGGREHDFYSGDGSHTPAVIDPYVSAVRAFLASRPSPPVVVDVGCGDFVASSRLVDVSRSFVACDVVPELIERNRRRFAREHLTFTVLERDRRSLAGG